MSSSPSPSSSPSSPAPQLLQSRSIPSGSLATALLSLALLCLALTVGCGTKDRSGPAAKRGPAPRPVETRVELTALETYAGKLPDEVGVWETQPLKQRMQELLAERYPAFLGAMAEAEPISLTDGLLVIRGKTVLRQRTDRGLAVISPKDGGLFLWMRIDGRTSERHDRDLILPSAAREWMTAP